MKILITAAQGATFDRHFPENMLNRLRAIGEVELNPHSRSLTRDELRGMLSDKDIVVTHWGTPQIDRELLESAPKLRLLAHAAGTVAHIASEAFYEKGIPVLSANSIMARYVAESVLGYMIAALHMIPQHDRDMHAGRWNRREEEQKSLFGCDIGLIGLGTVGRKLLNLLRPFGCRVHVYDPYIRENALDEWEFARLSSFEEAMNQPVVSVHAAQTPETFHMIDEKALSMMADGGLLINSSRGSLVDTQALIAALRSGRIRAVLDVYEQEGPGNQPEELLALDNVLLQPHMAASAVTWQMTDAVIDDIERMLRGEEMKLQVSLNQYRLMTQE